MHSVFLINALIFFRCITKAHLELTLSIIIRILFLQRVGSRSNPSQTRSYSFKQLISCFKRISWYIFVLPSLSRMIQKKENRSISGTSIFHYYCSLPIFFFVPSSNAALFLTHVFFFFSFSQPKLGIFRGVYGYGLEETKPVGM